MTATSAAKKAAQQKSASAKAETKPAAKAAKSSADTGKRMKSVKSALRAPASRAGTITKPVKIPPLKRVLVAVSDVVAACKEEQTSAAPRPPSRSPKAPAGADNVARRGKRSATASGGANHRGPEFPRNAHKRGVLEAAVKRQQARRDSR